MASTFSPNLHLELQVTGEDNGTWGDNLNNNVFSIVDNAMGRVLSLPLAGADVTLTTTQSQNNFIDLSGTLSANVNVIFPQIGRTYFVRNGTTGAFTVTLKTSAVGGATVAISQGDALFFVLNGTDVVQETNDPWWAMPIGVPFPIMTHKGATEPPTTKGYRYVKLTAADAYNTGVLTSETVSGSAPLVIATAVVSLAGSPMNGQTINLWNTEGRSPRPNLPIGTLQMDAFQGHAHAPPSGQVGFITSGPGGSALVGGSTVAALAATGGPVSDGTNGTPRVGIETRVKNEAVPYYMRIK
ncbi:hypothetical protein FHT87_005148 [Rhizobium sp. BK316]|uniref:hypothetical protein n=1 Tax=Rhizobium sp. BK316 TaxID=2587053 RepID=UPI001607DF62|nr:hypothetical protein [Rhizobium sp. BK316]MBB3411195.1 hypothetical protein [Rhizobium sp. BK316]